TICDALKLDPWGLIASGALLITTDPEGSSKIIDALDRSGFPSAVIGKITDANAGLTRIVNGSVEPLPTFERDEIARLYSS
ncbi:MAG TPA: hydrogenase expression protein, partial [Dehalococcoidia bacterium]|nr:hydrogenase expression protein [Dehalococcoidia bacterium]